MFLEINKISKSFGEKKAVDDVSFGLEKGSMTCILGPSGCGKTTVLKILGGFLKVDSGTIILDNLDITNENPEERPISTVFQSYGLFPHKNVLGNVIYGLKFKGLNRKKSHEEALKTIEMVGLKGYEQNKISELSGGEQQRVAIARSLAMKPNLLLLDEPFSNLDAKLKVIMRKEIQRIQETFGITTIFVTHDQEDAFSVANQIIIMNKGKIEQISDPVEIYNNPSSEFVTDFIGKSNIKKDGDKIFFVRPESVKIVAENGIPATVESAVFGGSVVNYLLRTDEGEVFASMNLSSEKTYNQGDKLLISYEYKQI